MPLQQGGSRFAVSLRRADGVLASKTPATKRSGQMQVWVWHEEGGGHPVLFLGHFRRAGRAGRVEWELAEASPPAEPRLQGGSSPVLLGRACHVVHAGRVGRAGGMLAHQMATSECCGQMQVRRVRLLDLEGTHALGSERLSCLEGTHAIGSEPLRDALPATDRCMEGALGVARPVSLG
jgi:hypothetical protein